MWRMWQDILRYVGIDVQLEHERGLMANASNPSGKRSHSRAAPRPSLIAHTTRLCPRRMSPAAKTPGTLVANCPYSAPRRGTFERASCLETKLLDQRALRPQEAHRQQHQLRRPALLGAGQLAEARPAVRLLPLHPHGVHLAHVAVGIANKALGENGKLARVPAEECRGPLPGRSPCGRSWATRATGCRSAGCSGRPGHDLQLHDAGAAVAHRRADAVGPRVTATDHHHVLVPGRDPLVRAVNRRRAGCACPRAGNRRRNGCL